MASNTVSIGFDYRKQLEKACKDIEQSFDKAIGSHDYGIEFEKQISNFRTMIRDMKDDLSNSFKGLSEGKLSTEKFDVFREKVNNKFQSINDKIENLTTNLDSLNKTLGFTGSSVDLSNAIGQFKELQEYINTNNEAVTRLIKTLKTVDSDVEINVPKLSVDEAKAQIELIKELYDDLDADVSVKYKNIGSKQMELELQNLADVFETLQDKRYELEEAIHDAPDKSDKSVLKLNSELAQTELQMGKIADEITYLYDIAEQKGYKWFKSLDMMHPIQQANNQAWEINEEMSKIQKNAKNAMSDLQRYIDDVKNSTAKISDKLQANTGEVKIQVKISTKDQTLIDDLRKKVNHLQSEIDKMPLTLPVKMVVSNAKTKSDDPLKTTKHQIDEARKKIIETDEDTIVPDKLHKQTLKQALLNAEAATKESIKRIQGIFDNSPISIHLEVPESEIHKISDSVFSEDGKTKIDIAKQIDAAQKKTDKLVQSLKEVDQTASQTITKNKYKGLSEEIKSSLSGLNNLKDILNSIKDLETTIARAAHVATSSDITNQWNKTKFWFDYISDSDGKLNFRNKKQIATLMDEYQKYISMGGKNPLRDLTDNSDTIKRLYNHLQKLNKTSATETTLQSVDESSVKIIEEATALDEAAEAAKNAAVAKDKFKESNELLAISANESVNAITDEVNAIKVIENIDLDKNSDEFKKASDAAREYCNDLGEIASIIKTSGTYNTYNKHTGQMEQELRTSYRVTDVHGNSRTFTPNGDIIGTKDVINVTEAYKDCLKIQQQIYEINKKEASGQKLIAREISDREKLLKDLAEQQELINTLESKGLKNAELKDELTRRALANEDTINQLTKNNLVNDPLQKYKDQISKLNSNKNLSKQTQNYVNKLHEIEGLYDNLKAYKDIDVFTDQDVIDIEHIRDQIDGLLKDLSDMDKAANQAKASGVLLNITDYIAKNTNLNMSKQGRGYLVQLAELQARLKKVGLTSTEIQDVVTEFNRLKIEITEAGIAGKSFFDVMKSKAFYMAAEYLARYFSLQDIIRYTKQAAQNVINLNTQMTELAKVSDTSIKQLNADFKSYAITAKEVGGTISDTISATADWARMGYNLHDSKELSRVALIYKNVGDGIDISAANESLISTLQGFQMEADEAMHIIDVFNETSNNFAISSAGIGEALQRSAASFSAAHTSLEKSVALVTTTNTVLQDPQVVGNLWKTMSARIRGKFVPFYSESYNVCFE